MDDMKARHKGYFDSRVWHKIRWKKGTNAGKCDLFTDEDLEKHKQEVDVLQTFKTEKCATGVPFAFGRTTEAKIDEWIKKNKR